MANKPRFPGQLSDEKVIIYERRHWYTIFHWIGGGLLFFLLISSLIAGAVIKIVAPPSGLGLLILVPVLIWLGWRVLDWENDRYIVTDKRVIHIEKKYLMREKRDEAPLAMIEEVFIEMEGLMSHLLYFGDVTIQTAGTLGTVRFRGIQKPRKAQAQILALVSQAKPAMSVEEEPQAMQDVREMVGWSKPEPEPLPPAAEGLRWESEKPRREQIPEVIRMMFVAKQAFGENAIVWRKHWWALVNEIISPLLAPVVPLILWALASIIFDFNLWFDVLLLIALAADGVWLVWRSIDWRNDLYVITDDRVIDIEKVPFAREQRRETGLDKIQDVRYWQEGIIASRLDFGDVRLETAGGIGEFTFDYVPHPREVQIEIFNRMEQFHQRAAEEERKRRREEFIELLGRYHQRVAQEPPPQ